MNIIFESHSTSVDNEGDLAAGHFDSPLSEVGEMQARALGKRRMNDDFDVIFCSDLQRSYRTAEIAFDRKFIITQDARLRECDYGKWNRDEKDRINKEKPLRIDMPYPGGESWTWAVSRVVDFLKELETSDYENVLIIGHRATQYGLEHYINGVPIREAVLAPWAYQPGWTYELANRKL